MSNLFLESAIKQFLSYKTLGEKAIDQVSDDKLNWQYNEESNSIAIIVKHLWGNMLSRWTNFLTEDGEKEWRNRDAEFIGDIESREEILKFWEEGWKCVIDALQSLDENDLFKEITIRGEKQAVIDAIHRQLAHYAGHVGQIVYISKMVPNTQWESLSIPKGQSQQFTNQMLNKNKT